MRFLLVFIFIFSFAKEIKTLRCYFTQTITSPDNKIIIYKGQIIAKAPTLMVWRYKEPVIKNVYINKNVVIIDEPLLEQAIISKLQDEINLFDLLKKLKKIENNKYVVKLKDTKYFVTMQDNIPKTIEYEDKLENKIVIKLTNPKINIFIDKSSFYFKVPKYYDIIRK